MLLEHHSPPVARRDNVVVVDKIVGLILHCSPPVAHHESRSRMQLLHQVVSGKQCHQNACVASSSRPERLEAVRVKEKTRDDEVHLRQYGTVYVYSSEAVHCNHMWQIHEECSAYTS